MAVNVRFTSAGHKVIVKAIGAVERADESFFGVLTKRDLARLKALMLGTIEGNTRSS